MKNENFKKMKKNPWDIIISHKCTKNHDHTVYGSWDMTCDRCTCYFSFWAILVHFTSLTAQKMKMSKKMKKTPGDVIILHKSTKNHDRMLYCPWDMARDICNCHFSFWAIFCPFNPPAPFPPHLTPKKIKILKNWNFTHVYQKLWLDDVRFLRYGVRRTDGRTDGRTEKVTRGVCTT